MLVFLYFYYIDGIPQTWSIETNRESFMGLKYKNVTNFAYNMKDTPIPRLCLVVKKKLVLLDYARGLFQVSKEISVSEPPPSIIWTNNTLFFINKHNYFMINTLEQSKPQPVNCFPDPKQPLCMKTTGEDETIFSIGSYIFFYNFKK